MSEPCPDCGKPHGIFHPIADDTRAEIAQELRALADAIEAGGNLAGYCTVVLYPDGSCSNTYSWPDNVQGLGAMALGHAEALTDLAYGGEPDDHDALDDTPRNPNERTH